MDRRIREMTMGLIVALGAGAWGVAAQAKDCDGTSTGLIPINDLGTGRYLEQFQGGLYPAGLNQPPSDHRAAGLIRAGRVQPLDGQGLPDPDGHYVLISIGMSNTTQEFCGGQDRCMPGTFMDQALNDARVNHAELAILDGARGGQTASTWDSPADANYDRVRDQVLAPRGLTEAQVQAVWVKVANASPRVSLPNVDADAYVLLRQMGDIVRALKVRYPNVQTVFFSSRIYAGYADTPLNPEPYAYESAFAVKWLIQAQIHQMRTGDVDPIAGDLDLDGPAPWVAWAAYLWADGLAGRSDGLVWECDDFRDDGTHPGPDAQLKVGTMLLDFFLNSEFTRSWFTADGGGGVPCDDVRKGQARCRRGTLKIKLVLTDASHDGERVTFEVNGELFDLTIIGDKAKLKLPDRSGLQTIRLVDPPDCLNPITVDCE